MCVDVSPLNVGNFCVMSGMQLLVHTGDVGENVYITFGVGSVQIFSMKMNKGDPI